MRGGCRDKISSVRWKSERKRPERSEAGWGGTPGTVKVVRAGVEGRAGQTLFSAFIFGKFACVGEWRRPF